MKKSLIILTLSLAVLSNVSTLSAKTKTYKLNGTIRNYTSSVKYNDGTGYYSEGAEITDSNGNIWIMEDIYNTYKDGQKVTLTMDTMGTKSIYDDEIISISYVETINLN